MLETLTHETFEPHIGTDFVIRTDNHNEALTLTKVEPGKHHREEGRQSFALLFDGSSADLMVHSQLVRLEHGTLGALEFMISPVGRNESGTFRYEAIFN